eukprot:356080-Chlamydomonas_euryale.AAC.1
MSCVPCVSADVGVVGALCLGKCGGRVRPMPRQAPATYHLPPTACHLPHATCHPPPATYHLLPADPGRYACAAGYLLTAAAVLGRFDAEWLSEHKNRLLDVVRDIAAPPLGGGGGVGGSGDPGWFPAARHTDWFAGHSWTSGLQAFADGKNQESTSEAVNAWYGVALLGDALRDAPLAALGRTLLASEAASAQAYWQMPSGSRVYPRPFRDNVVVGVLWGTKADYSTWFGDLPEYMTLIQALPFTPASTALLPAGWAGEAYAAAAFRAEAGAEPRITDGFRAMLHMLQVRRPLGWRGGRGQRRGGGGEGRQRWGRLQQVRPLVLRGMKEAWVRIPRRRKSRHWVQL